VKGVEDGQSDTKLRLAGQAMEGDSIVAAERDDNADTPARGDVSPVRPKGAETCHHDREVTFVKSMGRNKRVCKKCRVTELM